MNLQNSTIRLGLFILLAPLFLACSSSDDNQPTVIPTALDLYMKDNLGNPEQGVDVKLYPSQNDFLNGTNQVGSTQTSDANGKVRFSGLSPTQYYWLAEKGCQNNVNGAVTSTGNIPANQTTNLDIVLTETGTIQLVSTSSYNYQIFINGTAVFTMAGGTSRFIEYVPTGNYSVRVLQLDGYILYPTDKTYTGNVACGGTLLITYP